MCVCPSLFHFGCLRLFHLYSIQLWVPLFSCVLPSVYKFNFVQCFDLLLFFHYSQLLSSTEYKQKFACENCSHIELIIDPNISIFDGDNRIRLFLFISFTHKIYHLTFRFILHILFNNAFTTCSKLSTHSLPNTSKIDKTHTQSQMAFILYYYDSSIPNIFHVLADFFLSRWWIPTKQWNTKTITILLYEF